MPWWWAELEGNRLTGVIKKASKDELLLLLGEHAEKFDDIHLSCFWVRLGSTLQEEIYPLDHWLQMKADTYKVCESCVTCLSTQGQERCPRPPLKSTPVGEPFECIGMDFKEFDVSKKGTLSSS